MTTHPSEIADMARSWAIRVANPAFDDWDGLTVWLESDPAHLAAYETALDDDRWTGELFAHERHVPVMDALPPASPAMASPAVPSRPAFGRRRLLAAGGAFAAVIALVGSWTVLRTDGDMQEVATAPGERRTIALADGSRMILNGGTRVRYDPAAPRHVELAHGEALFDVRHDDRDPFVVIAGGTRLVDAGTIFNVVEDGGTLDVAVAHGVVIYAPGRDAIRLNAGDALSRPAADARPVLRKAATDAIGGWRTGVLQYEGATLAQVARDLGRNIGRPIRPVAGADRMRFTGTLMVSGPAAQVLARTGPLLGVTFEPEGDSWRMTPADGTRP